MFKKMFLRENLKKFKFKYVDKKFSIEVEECRNFFSKIRGLMFKKKSHPLLFIFEKPTKQPIHSFFCKPFIAIWFLNKEIVDLKYVKPWTFSIKPKIFFNLLLEIPKNHREFNTLKELIR